MRSIILALRRLIHRLTQLVLQFERRLEPFFRQRLNRLVRAPLARWIQRRKNSKREDFGLG